MRANSRVPAGRPRKSTRDPLRELAGVLMDLLREIEWTRADKDAPFFCPRCGGPASAGHTPSCDLDNVLRSFGRCVGVAGSTCDHKHTA